MINLGTFGLPGWHASHIGIVADVRTDLGQRRLVFESTSVLPDDSRCELTGEPVHGVQAHTLHDFAARPGLAWIYPIGRALYSHEADRLSQYLVSRLGHPYDLRGALRSGGVLFSFIESVLHQEDLATLFCSELVASSLEQVGLVTFRNASSWSPNKLVRRLTWRGLYSDRVALDPKNFSSGSRRIQVSTKRV
jgi:hypothetical protein